MPRRWEVCSSQRGEQLSASWGSRKLILPQLGLNISAAQADAWTETLSRGPHEVAP